MDSAKLSAPVMLTTDDIWHLYTLLHDASVPMEQVVATVDDTLRQAWLAAWVNQFASHLTLLGLRRIVAESGNGQTIVIEVDSSESP